MPRRGGPLHVSLGVGLRGQGNDVGELGHRLQVADLRQPRQSHGVQAVAREERQVGVLGPQHAPRAVVLEVALDDRLDEQRVVGLAPVRARAGRGDGAERGRRRSAR